jgi:Protein of unknown function (DUF1592)/Protein of unknown function (DUF1588)/Protein of unknown function (DUF1595)/Protein of unknown function (DUF1587)
MQVFFIVFAMLLALGCTGSVGNSANGPDGPGTSNGSGGGSNPGSGAGNPGSGAGNPGSGAGNPGSGAGNPGSAGGGMSTQPPTMATCAPQTTKPRIWRLTQLQYQKAVAGLMANSAAAASAGLGADSTAAGFSTDSNSLVLGRQDVPDFTTAADALSAVALAAPASLGSCLGQATGFNDTACVQSVVSTVGQKAFRRPLEASESAALMALYQAEKTASTGKEAVQQVLRALLQSPNFIYRTELGAPGSMGPVSLTEYEKASLLSFALNDAPPDATLMTAAAQSGLGTRAAVDQQVRRLLAVKDAETVLGRFGVELLGVSNVADVAKDPALVKGFGPAVSGAMRDEVASFTAQIAFREDKTFKSLMTSNIAVIDKVLAPWYGVPVPAGGLQRVTLPAAERAGLLTRLAMMTEYSTDVSNGPIQRGLMIRDQFLCNGALTVPANIPPAPPVDPTKTLRQQLIAHSVNPACASCHMQMDPLGFAFEMYDLTGRFRTLDQGQAVDTTGTAKNVAAQDIAHSGAIDLSAKLAVLPEAQSCFVRQLGRFYLGREVTANSCDLANSFQSFSNTGTNMIEPVVTYLTDAVLSQRVP